MNLVPSSLPLPDPSDAQAFWDTLRQLYERTAAGLNSLVRTGVMGVAMSGALPTGALACNGAAVSRTVYAPLFALVGTSFGSGDGRTTFNLPTISAPATGATYFIWT